MCPKVAVQTFGHLSSTVENPKGASSGVYSSEPPPPAPAPAPATMSDEEEKETEYHSKDFEWDELRRVIESDPSLSHHFLLVDDPTSSSSPSSSLDSQAWSRFHTRHSTGKFFKERRYLMKEFPELASCDEFSKVLEVGCGNGSTALPILRSEALERATEVIHSANIISSTSRFRPFCCDFSTSGFPEWLICDSCQGTSIQNPLLCNSDANKNLGDLTKTSLSDESKCCIGGVDFVTLIFTLSAVPLQRMPRAIAQCFSVLTPGGLLLFRDYGLYDMTMLRFERDQKVGFREYMRSDGTRSYFFSLDIVRNLFISAGFLELELEYCCVKSVNRRKGKTMRRVWVHGKFQKPMQTHNLHPS